MIKWAFLLILFSASYSVALQSDSALGASDQNLEIPRGYVLVGDMILPEENILNDNGSTIKGFKEKRVELWPDGILPIKFSKDLTPQQEQMVVDACVEMGEFADIQCVEKNSSHKDYVFLKSVDSRSCGSSLLGREGGRQTLSIRCWRKRTIQHELMHAFGVSHHHNRPDRDNHVVILWNNLKFLSRFSYVKVSNSATSHMLSYYDYESIMHYDSRSGSSNGQVVMYKKGFTPKTGYIRQTDVMSIGDHFFLYSLYGGENPIR